NASYGCFQYLLEIDRLILVRDSLHIAILAEPEPRQATSWTRLVLYRQGPTCRASDARLPRVAAGTDPVYDISADGQFARGFDEITSHPSELATWADAVTLWRQDPLFGLVGSAQP